MADAQKAGKLRSFMSDTLQNLVSMLGTVADKNTYNEFVFTPMDRSQQEAAYRGDWVARKVVNIPAQDATRDWREWRADEAEIELLEKTETRLQLRSKVRVAMIKARLYGGGGLILGFGDGQHDKPLNLETVKKDGLKYVHPFARHEVTCAEPDGDIEGSNFGLPLHYTVNNINATAAGPQIRVHPSRVVRFCGAELPDRSLSSDGWGDSVLEALIEAVKNVSVSSSSMAALLQETKLDIVKIPGFMEGMQSSDYRNKIIERFSLVNRAKSTVNTLLLDKEEEWQRINASFAGIPDLMKLYLLIASGAADIPATRMLSQSAQGLNATGEGDMRNYADMVRSVQTNEITPAMQVLDEVVVRSALGKRPDGIWYDWVPLWQLTPKEKAEISKSKADTVKVLVDSGTVDPEVLAEGVKSMLIDDGTFPGIEDAYEEFEKSGGGVDETDPEVQKQFGELKSGPSSKAPSGPDRGAAGGGNSPGRPRPALRVVGDGLTADQIRGLVFQAIDEFNEANIERAPNGQFGSGGGGSKEKAVSAIQGMTAQQISAMPVKGGSNERVTMRAALKGAPKEEKSALQGKILESFKVDYDKAVKAGNGKKAAELQAKSAQYSKSYGKPDPVVSGMTIGHSAMGFSAKEVSVAKEIMKAQPPVGGGKYSPVEVQAFNDLVKLSSENTAKDYAKTASSKLATLKSVGVDHGLTAAEAAHIVAYSGNSYIATNSQLRSGALTEATWGHVTSLNNALDKLPDHKGVVIRKAEITPSQAALYKVGMIVEERGFTSSSKSTGVWNGDTRYTITSKTGKDISRLSLSPNEQEVLFRSGTRFKVTKVDEKKSSYGEIPRNIHMEEVRGR